MKTVNVYDFAGEFAENKDAAQTIRNKQIIPAIKAGDKLVVDFTGVNLATQSFVHALLSQVIRDQTDAALDLIRFKGCNSSIKNLISIVVEYSQEIVDTE